MREVEDRATAGLVELLSDLAGRVSPAAREAATALTQDFLGVAIAGSRTPEAVTLLHTVTKIGRGGPCSIPASRNRFDAPTAALLTGTAGYSIGLTDTHAQSITHPGPSVIPAALAVGEDLRKSGREVLDAIVLGYENVQRIGAVVNPSHRSRGFHPTATCNVFGAAAAVSRLLGLDRQRTAWALGLAGSMAGGLYEFRHEGAMLMALHGGLPAANGAFAAYLAADGFTGPTTVLEGSDGFFRAFADTTRPEMLLAESDHFGVEEVSLRPYCACRYAHAGIDALERLWTEHGRVSPSEVAEVTVFTHRTAVEQESEPNSVVGARLSTRFNIALALLKGPRLSEISIDELADPALTAIFDRTSVREDPALTAIFPAKWACRVRLRLASGEVWERQVETPKGEPENPLTRQEISEKFHRLAEPVVGPGGASRLEQAVAELYAATDVGRVTAAMAGVEAVDVSQLRELEGPSA